MSDPFAEAALLMADSRYALGREYSAPLGTVTAGRLAMPRGSGNLTIRGAADPSLLFQARFGSVMAEVVSDDEGAVRVIYHRHGGPVKRAFSRPEQHQGLLLLNRQVPWTIACVGGTVAMRADLRDLTVNALTISHGVADVEIDLGAPGGVVPISIRGGVSQVTIRRPHGSAARVRVKGGASKLTVDQHYLDAAGGTVVLATADIDRMDARYEFDIVGGVSNVRIITRAPAADDRSAPPADESPRPAR